MDVKEQIALSILKGAGGDVDKDYTSTNDIYKDVESIYRAQDNRQDVDPLQVELIDNGTYTYDDRNTQGYKPVEITVNVPVEDYYNSGFENGIVIQKAKLEAITITENGIYNKEDGYDEVEVNIDTQSFYDNGYNNGTQDQKSKLESITITENGIYNKEDGYNNVDVNIDTQSYYDNGYNNGYSEGDNNGYERGYGEGVDNGIQEQKAKLESITIESNGTYIKEDGYDEVIVALDIPKTKIYNGFRFVSEGNNDYKRIKDIDFSLYDWSGVYELEKFFNEFDSTDGGGLISSDFDNFIENFDGEILSCASMFHYSDALKEAPNFGDKTKNCLNMYGMFAGCTSLTSIPQLDTSNVTDMQYMFNYCRSLTSIPQLDTGKVTDMGAMFASCNNLTTIPQLDTSNVINMSSMFNGCDNLTTIPHLDLGRVSSVSLIFGYSDIEALTDLGGFRDLGKQSSVTGINSGFLERAPNLTHESLMNVINNIYDRKANGLSTLTINFGTTNLNKLTDEEKSIAINKGWNLS